MGDDMPDIPLFEKVGLSCCPKDASIDVLDRAEYIANANGGEGCVREIIEKVMKLQNSWFNDDTHRW
jgi:3-deoxy-D-manno-octulosonate 8-phosphate phosphatase (KDO 8-P phosphatase)